MVAEKNLKYQEQLLNLLTFENLHPNYIKLNPKGVVPTLIHGDRTVTNSKAIIHYLDKQFPQPNLTPTESKLRQQMNDWIELQDRFPMRELMYGNYRGIEGIILRRSVRIKEQLLPKLIQAHPDLKEDYIWKLEDVKQWNQKINSKSQITTLNKEIELILEQLASQLNRTKWLCGDNYSLADIVWTATLKLLAELKFHHLWQDNQGSAISNYLALVKKRRSFELAIERDTMPLKMQLEGSIAVVLGKKSSHLVR